MNFIINLNKYKLLEYEEEKTENFIVLESYTHTPNKTIHIWEVPNDRKSEMEFDVGRSSGVSVRITGKNSANNYFRYQRFKSPCEIHIP